MKKRIVSLVLTITFIIALVPASAIPASAQMMFEEYVVASIENFTENIEIGHYIRNNSDWLQKGQTNKGHDLAGWFFNEKIPDILDNNPLLFYIDSSIEMDWYPDFSSFTITLNYIMTPAQYSEALRKFNAAAEQAMSLVRGAKSDFERALVLHNYIVLNTAYDSELLVYYQTHGMNVASPRPLSHTAYGALVDGVAVCDGYAKAYLHLLRLAGIESRLISGYGRSQPHAWNIVKLDGNWYHTDPTWSAATNAPHGIMSYEFYLLNSSEINKTHTSWTLPDGIRTDAANFSNAFFRNANSAVAVLGDYFYYIESDSSSSRGTDNNSIRRHNINTGRTDTLYSFEAVWFANSAGTSVWMNSYIGLAAYNDLLYFNTANEILSFNPETGEVEVVHQPANLGGSGNRFIYGMTMNENIITYTVKTEPSALDNLSTVKVPLAPAPEIPVVLSFTTADAMLILQSSAGLIMLTAQEREKYDLNGDGVITTADAMIVLQIVAGIVTINN
jgi:hypothetical protein